MFPNNVPIKREPEDQDQEWEPCLMSNNQDINCTSYVHLQADYGNYYNPQMNPAQYAMPNVNPMDTYWQLLAIKREVYGMDDRMTGSVQNGDLGVGLPSVECYAEPPTKIIKIEPDFLSNTTIEYDVDFTTIDNNHGDSKQCDCINNTGNADCNPGDADKLAGDTRICDYDTKPDDAIKPKPSQTFEIFLQQLFSWNPQWLQGRAITKPPVRNYLDQFDHKLTNSGHMRYDEYTEAQVPHILCRLFMELSDEFKSGAPSRLRHPIYVAESVPDGGPQALNLRLTCYAIRDLQKYPAPIGQPDDIVILVLDVTKEPLPVPTSPGPHTPPSPPETTSKQYFGQIQAQTTFETHELSPDILASLDAHLPLELIRKGYLLCDRLTIVTKRSTESYIMADRMATVEVMLNAGVGLRSADNLLSAPTAAVAPVGLLRATIAAGGQRLVADVAAASARVYRPPVDRQALVTDTIDMIRRGIDTGPPLAMMASGNGATMNTSLIVLDVPDDRGRRQLLSDILIQTISHYANSGNYLRKAHLIKKCRFLVIGESMETCTAWRERLNRQALGVRVWSLDGGRGWTRHAEVRRASRVGARQVAESCRHKLRQWRRAGDDERNDPHRELSHRRRTYERVMKACDYPVYSKVDELETDLRPAVHIGREELFSAAFETLINTYNVVIGTFETALNCRQMLSQPFDCCIIDDSHRVLDPWPLSLLHTGIHCMVLAGNSSQPVSDAMADDPLAAIVGHRSDSTLFHRCINAYNHDENNNVITDG